MLARFLLFFVITIYSTSQAQQAASENYETYPVFPDCEEVAKTLQKSCFETEIINRLTSEIEIPENLLSTNQEAANILFEVTEEGSFVVLNIQTSNARLRKEINRVFSSLPQIQPALYEGRPTYMQFSVPIQFPLNSGKNSSAPGENRVKQVKNLPDEYDRISTTDYNDNEYSSALNIPFSHQVYSRFDQEINEVGTNSHTAGKPFVYSEVNKYYDFKAEKDDLLKDKSSWWGRKFWNEHMVALQGKDYWFTLDPAADLMLGKETADHADKDFTYNNTRALVFQGGLGKNFNFYTVFYESQGTFPGYFNRYARSIRPDGGNPAIVPGRGVAAASRAGDFDYPVATGYLSYSPSTHFNIQLGHGKQFIGDGYRSLLLSDNASPYPYVKLNTSFWKLKYTNTFMSLRDVRPEVTADGSFRTKYMANHYLSYNVTKRLNLGFFENVIWENENDRGIDLNYLNPVIFYRAIEFSTGSRGGNALIGLAAKYKFSNRFNAYAQLILDEFSVDAITGGEKSYKNKQGIQLGFKYYDAFAVEDLQLQVEFNQVRPYVYSNNEITLNYGHNNQSMAHQWGANFRELIGVARYEHKRWYATAKMIYGERGYERGNIDETYYGGSIYGNDENRPADTGIKIGQGNTANTLLGDLQVGYLLNPATNLKIYASVLYRDQQTDLPDPVFLDEQTLWFNLGFRTDLFNWYFDY